MMKRALPSQLRRTAILAECYPTPEGAAIVLLAAAAVGSAIDAAAPSGKWPTFGKARASVLDYGEGVYDVLIESMAQEDIAKEGWALITEWIGLMPAPVTDEALEEALTPTVAATAAPIISSGGPSAPSSSVT